MKAGRELDSLVAEKVMGLTLDYEFADVYGAPTSSALRDKYDEIGLLPEYSTDIKDTWKVVEQSNTYFEMFNNPIKKIWAARFVPGDFVTANTAPLAICLAALKAVGIDVEKEITEAAKDRVIEVRE